MTLLTIGTPSIAYKSPITVAPYAFFCLGSSQVANAPGFVVGQDLMGGSALVATGTPTDNGGYATTSDSAYWKTQFKADTLVSSVSSQNGATLIGVARRVNGSPGELITSYDPSHATPCFDLTLGAANLVGGLAQPNARVASLAADAARGSRFGMYAMTVTPTALNVYERHAGAGLQSANPAAFASQTIGGDFFYIGNRTDVSSDGLDVACAAFWGRALTPTELNQVYTDLDAWLTPLGVALS